MIDGVIIKELTTHSDERGFFREVFRFAEEFKDISIGQFSHSLVNEGVVKAWHGHKFQSQWNYVISGSIKVVLYDNRPDSMTYREIMEFEIGNDSRIIAYFFPPGVLHGYRCLTGPMNIFYITSGIYDLNEETRKHIENSKIDYNWIL